MIGAVTVKAGGADHTLRLSTRAMLGLERKYEKPIMEVLQGMETDSSVGRITALFAAVMNDGRGADEDAALDLIDEIGGMLKAVEVMGKVMDAAFPDDADGKAEGGAPAGTGEGAEAPGNGKPARKK